MREVVTSFTGVAHRLELVREAGGVRYYNDSIATSPARAIAGLRSFDEPVLLIAGGYDKQLPLDEFAEVVVEKAKAVFLIGQTARKIQEAILKARGERDRPRIVLCESLDEAVREAHRAASPETWCCFRPRARATICSKTSSSGASASASSFTC